jgi:hypothetical protein
MKLSIIPVLTLSLGLTGCLIPIGNKGEAGYSAESLAFLKEPGTTRAQVIASLGDPLIDHAATRTLVYVRDETTRYVSLEPKKLLSEHRVIQTSVVDGSPDQWALLIAYDEHGIIVAHTDRYLDTQSLEQECLDWYRRRNKR